MKILFILISLLSNDPKEIAKINALKKEAEEAFLSGNYEESSQKFSYLKDSLNVNEDEIVLNLAHSQYHLGDTASAKTNYHSLNLSKDGKLKSVALQQLGILSKDAGKLDVALEQLKSSIKANPYNQEARYNYEVVKKMIEDQKQQEPQNNDQQDQSSEDQQNQDQNQEQQQENQENQEGEQENQESQQGENQEEQEGENQEQEGENQDSEQQEQEGEQQEQQQQNGEEQDQPEEPTQEQMTQEKLKEMGISEEKARQLLEAMRQTEIKYLQSQKRKATKRPPSGKPDW